MMSGKVVIKRETMEDHDEDENNKKKRSGTSISSMMMRSCQAYRCNADLSDAKRYHRRHKVCEYHAKAEFAPVAGIRQRFCQQCSRFHELGEFDEAKRSCRRRLAGYNERRRKSSAATSSDSHVETAAAAAVAVSPSSRRSQYQLKDVSACGQVDEKGRIQISIQDNSYFKHFQIK